MMRLPERLLLTGLALACATAAIEDIAAEDGVAVCVAGQARTLNASAVYRNIHESMVRPLRDVLFEHPVEGRCGATAAALVGRPWALCPHDLC